MEHVKIPQQDTGMLILSCIGICIGDPGLSQQRSEIEHHDIISPGTDEQLRPYNAMKEMLTKVMAKIATLSASVLLDLKSFHRRSI